MLRIFKEGVSAGVIAKVLVKGCGFDPRYCRFRFQDRWPV
jgi:O-methyltransferase involved in polyketide biosynthesis